MHGVVTSQNFLAGSLPNLLAIGFPWRNSPSGFANISIGIGPSSVTLGGQLPQRIKLL